MWMEPFTLTEVLLTSVRTGYMKGLVRSVHSRRTNRRDTGLRPDPVSSLALQRARSERVGTCHGWYVVVAARQKVQVGFRKASKGDDIGV